MTYEILLDGNTLYYSGDEQSMIIDPKITLKMNDAGRCELTIPTSNPLYGSVAIGKSTIAVKKNDREVFYGEVKAYNRTFDMNKKIVAIGALSFLNRSIQPQRNYGNISNTMFLTRLLLAHNEQMFDDDSRKIQLGDVTIPDSANPVDKITDGETTLEAIRKNLVEPNGGVIRLRHTMFGNLYLDYITLEEYGSLCTQKISLGENLLDYTENFSAENIVTVVEPYGAKIASTEESEFETRVDITTVNDNKNYLLATNAAIANYGYNREKIVYDGIESPAELKAAAQTYLSQTQFEKAVFKLTAADLSAVDADVGSIYFGDRVAVEIPIAGLNATYPIIEMTMMPDRPEDEKITLSANITVSRTTLTGRTNNASRQAVAVAQKEVSKAEQAVSGEIANAIAVYAGKYGGYRLSEFDSHGQWIRDLYMDEPSKDDAVNIMEFSMRGIRFSNAGYKAPTDSAWKLVMTIAGKVVSQDIFSNIVFANLLKTGIIEDVGGKLSWNLENGYLKSGTGTNAKLLQIYQGIITGLYNGQEVGHINFNETSGNGTRKCVLQSDRDLVFEFNGILEFVNKTTGEQIGYIDNNGLHMDVV